MIHHVSNLLKDKHGSYFKVFVERKGVMHTILVDSDDYYTHVHGKSWVIQDCSRHCTTDKFYVKMNVGPRSSRRTVYLHRVITNPVAGMVIGHRDGSGLNNRRYNLYFVIQKDNATRQRHAVRRKMERK